MVRFVDFFLVPLLVEYTVYGGGGDKLLKNAAPSFPPVLPRGEEVKADAAFPKQRAVHPSMLVHSHARDR